MGRPRLSPWIDGSVRPIRVGVYERMFQGGDQVYAYWDGRQWYVGTQDRNDAAAVTQRSVVQRAPAWRGRAERAS